MENALHRSGQDPARDTDDMLVFMAGHHEVRTTVPTRARPTGNALAIVTVGECEALTTESSPFCEQSLQIHVSQGIGRQLDGSDCGVCTQPE
jgi:hypothetical protein